MRLQIILLYACTCFVSFVSGQPANRDNDEWPAYGHDGGGSRYSPLQQINTGNIKKLKPVWTLWTYQTGELKTYEGTRALEKALLKLHLL
ncbi:MAG: hypothetical protein WDO19_02960 [Bacteroidota bacterium]